MASEPEFFIGAHQTHLINLRHKKKPTASSQSRAGDYTTELMLLIDCTEVDLDLRGSSVLRDRWRRVTGVRAAARLRLCVTAAASWNVLQADTS